MNNKRRFLLMGLILLLSISLIACGGDSNNSEDDIENVESVNEGEEIKDESEEPKDQVYGKGEPWEVEGNWKLTVDSVITTDDRNEFSDKDPAQVVIIKYTYENLGYEDDIQDLFLTPDTVIDAEKKLGYSYPASITTNPQPTPVGAICEGAEDAFGLNNVSDTITIHFEQYDNDGNKQVGIFEVPVE